MQLKAGKTVLIYGTTAIWSQWLHGLVHLLSIFAFKLFSYMLSIDHYHHHHWKNGSKQAYKASTPHNNYT